MKELLFYERQKEIITQEMLLSLFPFTAFTHFGFAITTRMLRISRMLNTGTQYYPVDSMVSKDG